METILLPELRAKDRYNLHVPINGEIVPRDGFYLGSRELEQVQYHEFCFIDIHNPLDLVGKCSLPDSKLREDHESIDVSESQIQYFDRRDRSTKAEFLRLSRFLVEAGA